MNNILHIFPMYTAETKKCEKNHTFYLLCIKTTIGRLFSVFLVPKIRTKDIMNNI